MPQVAPSAASGSITAALAGADAAHEGTGTCSNTAGAVDGQPSGGTAVGQAATSKQQASTFMQKGVEQQQADVTGKRGQQTYGSRRHAQC